MKVALLATLLTFGGSVAGFGLVSGGSATPVAAPPPLSTTEDVVVHGGDRDGDCPKAKAEKA